MGVMSGVKSENCLSNKIGGTFQGREENKGVNHTCIDWRSRGSTFGLGLFLPSAIFWTLRVFSCMASLTDRKRTWRIFCLNLNTHKNNWKGFWQLRWKLLKYQQDKIMPLAICYKTALKGLGNSIMKENQSFTLFRRNHYAQKETHYTYHSYHPLQLSPFTSHMSLSGNTQLQAAKT